MSLVTDAIFVQALRTNASLMSQLADGDVYNTTIALPDEDLDNAPLPYAIVTYDGMENDGTTKDFPYEGDSDRVTISIEVAAETRPKLGELMEAIRTTIRNYFEDYHDGNNLIPEDYQLRAGAVQYDSLKPCYWQVLTYACDTNI